MLLGQPSELGMLGLLLLGVPLLMLLLLGPRLDVAGAAAGAGAAGPTVLKGKTAAAAAVQLEPDLLGRGLLPELGPPGLSLLELDLLGLSPLKLQLGLMQLGQLGQEQWLELQLQLALQPALGPLGLLGPRSMQGLWRMLGCGMELQLKIRAAAGAAAIARLAGRAPTGAAARAAAAARPGGPAPIESSRARRAFRLGARCRGEG